MALLIPNGGASDWNHTPFTTLHVPNAPPYLLASEPAFSSFSPLRLGVLPGLLSMLPQLPQLALLLCLLLSVCAVLFLVSAYQHSTLHSSLHGTQHSQTTLSPVVQLSRFHTFLAP